MLINQKKCIILTQHIFNIIISILFAIFSFLFGLIVKKRNNWYAQHQNKIVKCDLPVISVGNLSVGGTGKTPFVIELCKIMKEIDFSPCVIGSGYKRKEKNDVLVSDGEKIFVDASVGGDEMILIAQSAKIPVIAGKSKSKTAKLLCENLELKSKIDCIIIDDGFQHRKLHRDLDIVLIDNASLANPFLLPKGRLREPFTSLERADIICLAKGATKEKLLKNYPTNKPILETNFKFNKSYSLFQNEISEVSKTISVAGIAKPEFFIQMLQNENIEVLQAINFADHHNFSENDIKKIFEICTVHNCFDISITEKDAVKLVEFEKMFGEYKINVWVYPLKLSISSGKEILIKAGQLLQPNGCFLLALCSF